MRRSPQFAGPLRTPEWVQYRSPPVKFWTVSELDDGTTVHRDTVLYNDSRPQRFLKLVGFSTADFFGWILQTSGRARSGCKKAGASEMSAVLPIGPTPVLRPTQRGQTRMFAAALLLGTLIAPGAGTASAEDWLATRRALVSTLFGGDGDLPARSTPDAIETIPAPQAHGCYCAYFGFCNASDCAYGNNMTKLTWTIESRVKGDDGKPLLTLNSTVFHTLNTSGAAPQNHPEVGPPALPGGGWSGKWPAGMPALYPKERGETLVIFHHGHAQPCDRCQTPWVDLQMEWVNELGFDSMIIQVRHAPFGPLLPPLQAGL